MTDYTSTYTYNKIDDVDVVEASDFDAIDTEFTAIQAASVTKADKTGDTVSFASLTVTTSATFNGAAVADLGAVTTVDINGGTIAGVTIDGSLTWSAAQDFNSQILTNVNMDSGDISAGTISGSLTWSAAQNLNSQALTNVNIDSGDISAATISGALTWSATQDSVTLTNVDINSGAIDGTAIGAASREAGYFTNLDHRRSTWRRVANADSPVTAAAGEKIYCTCDGAIIINIPGTHSQNDTIVIRVDDACTSVNKVTITPDTGDSVAGQAANDTVSIDLPLTSRVLVADSSSATATNWDM